MNVLCKLTVDIFVYAISVYTLCMKPQKWNKTEAASPSYSFQEASAVYSRLVITCGTGPAGTEIRL